MESLGEGQEGGYDYGGEEDCLRGQEPYSGADGADVADQRWGEEGCGYADDDCDCPEARDERGREAGVLGEEGDHGA